MWIKRLVPNLLTLGNLACGVLAILFLLQMEEMSAYFNPVVMIAWLLSLAMIFDWLDGFAARMLKVAVPIGKQLDSLADMVTFGVLPGFIAYTLILYGVRSLNPDPATLPLHLFLLPYVGLLIPLFSALRLAKFNVDDRQDDSFHGMPTPANAFFFLSLFLIFFLDSRYMQGLLPGLSAPGMQGAAATAPLLQPVWDALTHPYAVAGFSVLFSLCLVADFKLLALKFKNPSLKDNTLRYLLVTISAVALLLLWYKAVPLIILTYFTLSLIENRFYNNEIPG